jgi:hypothetical protein
MHRSRPLLRLISRAGIVLGVVAGMAHADAVSAYMRTGGTSTQQVARTHARTALGVNQTTRLTGLAPGQPAQTLGGDFDNRNGAPVHVATVSVSIASVAKAPGAAAGTCDASDFALAHRLMTVRADVPSGRGTGAWSGATLSFRNKPGANQNACMGAAVKLRYTLS